MINILLIIIIKCVNCFFSLDSDELFGPISPFNPSKKLESELSFIKHTLSNERHPYSLQNPIDQLLRCEFDLIDKYSIRIELLFESINILIPEEKQKILEPIIKRNYENMLEIIKKSLILLQNNLLILTEEYEKPNYELKQREHRTFITYNYIEEIIIIIKNLLITLEMELNHELINIIKMKILLLTLSLRIIFLESIYNLGYLKGLNMIMSYNVQCIPWYLVPGYNIGIRSRILPKYLVEIVNKYSIDVLILQECFDKNIFNSFKNSLYHLLPFSTNLIGCKNEWDSTMNNSNRWLILINGGVCILSRYPIINRHQLIFKNCRNTCSLASKGACLAVINKGNKRINIIGTHLQAYDGPSKFIRQQQFNEIIQWLMTLDVNINDPYILAGDLNTCCLTDTSEFNTMLSNENFIKFTHTFDFKKDPTYCSITNDYCKICTLPRYGVSSLSHSSYTFSSSTLHNHRISSLSRSTLYGCKISSLSQGLFSYSFNSYCFSYCLTKHRNAVIGNVESISTVYDYILAGPGVKVIHPQTVIHDKLESPIKVRKYYFFCIGTHTMETYNPSDHYPIYSILAI
ncbi:sphingomyelinase, putative [Theileria annulata]|uniref:sphingomyelin phosphodiesterase n=1 Tax=Theileria annulata TaxID=5874 RepID=Q4UJ46_THEAN|nr:sphingomyelinase, putative [Theileria annulata]CAI72893.1 sphingomyelinase, putative [Theileria annulata]|eukprot:XP_953571.1 sphingomyelinase, putative [Theileria annulata]